MSKQDEPNSRGDVKSLADASSNLPAHGFLGLLLYQEGECKELTFALQGSTHPGERLAQGTLTDGIVGVPVEAHCLKTFSNKNWSTPSNIYHRFGVKIMSILQLNSSSSIASGSCSNSRSFQFSSTSSVAFTPKCLQGSGLVLTAASASPSSSVVDHKVETLLDSVKWDDKGLAVAIAQHVDTGAILMQGFANREALATTIQSRKATFYSRSRSSLWTKGETSKNFINVNDIFLDCDCDSIIYLGNPDGPTCHTGSDTCYYQSVFDFLRNPEVKENRLAVTTLYALESTISQRKAEIGVGNGKPSWTKKLLLDQQLLCSKIREEADELCQTLEENEDKSRTAAEAADLLFHSMVLLNKKGVQMEEVLEVLRRRFSQSGIEEKNSRNSKGKD